MELKDIELVSLQSTAGYVFAADSVRTTRPFAVELGTALAKGLAGADFVVHPSDRPVWSVRQGEVEFSKARRVGIVTLAGGAHELTVTVNGSTADARDVVLEAWARIGELAGEKEAALSHTPGSWAYSTTAVVRLPLTATELIPSLGAMDGFLRQKLGAALLRPEGVLPFRLSIPVSLAVRGLTVQRELVIEPRFTSLVEDRAYFTVSPLPSDDHLELLHRLMQSNRGVDIDYHRLQPDPEP